MGQIIIVDSDAQFLADLPGLLAQYPEMQFLRAAAPQSAIDYAARQAVHVVIVGPSVPPDQGIALAEQISASSAVILVAQRVTTELLRKALRAGAKDVLSVSDAAQETAASVRRAFESVEAGRSQVVVQAAEAFAQPVTAARVITVFSTKGGVGKTTIATNLAVILAQKGHRVVLVDLDLQFGDVGIMLQLPPDRTVFDASQAVDRLDAEMLAGFLSQHGTGLSVLLAPVQPEEADTVSIARLGRMLDLLQRMFDYVVIDTPAAFSDVVLFALDRSDEIYAVATMDVPSVKNTRISLQKLKQLGYDGDRVRLVLNRADSKVWLQPAEVEKVVEERIAAKIPSDRLVPRSVNKGVPIVVDEPKSSVSRSLMSLAGSIGVPVQESEVTGDVA